MQAEKNSTSSPSPTTQPTQAGHPDHRTTHRPAPTGRPTRSGNAFTDSYLLQARPADEAALRRRSDGTAHVPEDVDGGAFWAGPWEIEPVRLPHGACWAVVRRGESTVRGAAPAATCCTRAMALAAAAVFPALAVPNHLTLGKQASRSRKERGLGTPLHDGRVCLGHVRRPDPRLPAYLHALRVLMRTPESLALALETLDREELALLGRALVRRAT